MTSRDRYVDRIRAVVETRFHDPVVSHQSAAALWGIPLGGDWPGAVRGGWYFTDVEWPDFRLIGEFDGRAKYQKDEYLRGRTPGEVVYSEKVREDHLRAEGFRVVRWGMAELADRDALSRLLVAAGLPVIR